MKKLPKLKQINYSRVKTADRFLTEEIVGPWGRQKGGALI